VNPSTLEDSHFVISGRASRAVRPPIVGSRVDVASVASFRLTLALRAEARYQRQHRAAKVLKALCLVACELSL
jgi:hypothetical protein